MSGTAWNERSLHASARSYRPALSRVETSHRCAARLRADVAPANAFPAERFRSRVADSSSVRNDPRAHAARNGRGFRGLDFGPASGSYIGRPSLERLLDPRPDLIPCKPASDCATDVDWDLSAS